MTRAFPTNRAGRREGAALLRRWRRPRAVARLVAEIEERERAALLGYRAYDPAALRAELLSGAVVDVYEYADPRRVRGHIANLRRDGLCIGALGHGTGKFKLMPERLPRSRLRTDTRARLLSGHVVRYESETDRWPIINAVSDLRRAGHDVRCLGGGAYELVETQLSRR